MENMHEERGDACTKLQPFLAREISRMSEEEGSYQMSKMMEKQRMLGLENGALVEEGDDVEW